jgi:anti-anti-sigma factor
MTDATLDVRTIERDGDIDVVALHGELDRTNVDLLEAMLREKREEHRATIVDLNAATYVDSAGYAVLHRLSQTGQVAIVLSPGSLVHRATEIVGIASYEDIAAAKLAVSPR